MGLRVLPHVSMVEAKKIMTDLIRFTRDFLYLKLSDLKGRVLCVSQKDSREYVEAHPIFQSFRDTVEKTGILIVDTEGPNQNRLKSHGIPLQASSSMVEVLQLGDLMGHVIIIQTLQDCREEHMGCQCPKKCPKYRLKIGKRMECRSSCPNDRGDHKSWENRENLKIHGFADFPECIKSWLNLKSIFVIQSDIVCHSGTFGDKERVDRLLGSDCNSWVELHNIHAMFFGASPESCSYCQKEIEPDLYRSHMIEQHGLAKFLEGRKFGNGRLFRLFGLEDPSRQLEKCRTKNGHQMRVFNAPRHRPFLEWPRELLKYDAGDILIVAITLWSVTIDVMSLQELPKEASCLEFMRYLLHIIKQEPSLTVASAGRRAWPFEHFREMNVPGCSSKFQNGVPSYLPGGPGLKFPYPIRNIRQVVVDLADDQYYSLFRETNLPERYRIEDYDPIQISKSTRQIPPKRPIPRSVVAVLKDGRYFKMGYSDSKMFLAECKKNPQYFQPGLASSSFRIIKQDIGKEKDPDFFGICGKCGDPRHIRDQCNILCQDLKCIYPLCVSSGLHLIKTCRTLHHVCSACGRRGHRENHHEVHTPIELKTFFDYFSPWGFYTCLPILDALEDVGFPIKNNDFRFGYFRTSKLHNYGPMNAHVDWCRPSCDRRNISLGIVNSSGVQAGENVVKRTIKRKSSD